MPSRNTKIYYDKKPVSDVSGTGRGVNHTYQN